MDSGTHGYVQKIKKISDLNNLEILRGNMIDYNNHNYNNGIGENMYIKIIKNIYITNHSTHYSFHDF